jgi:hypothetical protein
MNTQNFVTFNNYHDKSILDADADILRKENIDVFIEDCSLSFDPTMNNNETSKDFKLKLLQRDFERANEILERNAEVDLDQLPEDYYLLSFSDEELYNIVKKKDEWGRYDLALAKKLLKKRGKEITKLEENELRTERMIELSEPDVSSNSWILIGYLIALLGGFIGIIWGVFLFKYKKTLPNGERVYGYTETQRRHGVFITLLGVICLTYWIIIRVKYNRF